MRGQKYSATGGFSGLKVRRSILGIYMGIFIRLLGRCVLRRAIRNDAQANSRSCITAFVVLVRRFVCSLAAAEGPSPRGVGAMPVKLPFTVVCCTGADDGFPATDLEVHGPSVKGWRAGRFCAW